MKYNYQIKLTCVVALGSLLAGCVGPHDIRDARYDALSRSSAIGARPGDIKGVWLNASTTGGALSSLESRNTLLFRPDGTGVYASRAKGAGALSNTDVRGENPFQWRYAGGVWTFSFRHAGWTFYNEARLSGDKLLVKWYGDGAPSVVNHNVYSRANQPEAVDREMAHSGRQIMR